MNLSTVRRYRRRYNLIAALLQKNPVMVLGLDLPFVIATSTTLRNAAAMSIMLLCIHIATLSAAKLTAGRLPQWARVLCHLGASTAIMVLTRMLVIRIFGQDILNSLGIYINLMAVNGMTMYQAMAVRKGHPYRRVLWNALQNVLGFALVMFVLSPARELLGRGTLWDITVPFPVTFPGLLIPFSGFIAVGFLLALWRFFNKKITAWLVAEAARAESHHIRFRGRH